MATTSQSSKPPKNILDITEKNIKSDMLYFKEEILKDMKQNQKKYSERFYETDDMIRRKLENYDSKIIAFEAKIKELSNQIQTDKTIKEKIEQLSQFKDKTSDTLLTESLRVKNLEDFTKSNISNLEKIISDSVLYPGIIGKTGKFKNFHTFIDYIIVQIQDYITFKEKSIFTLTPYKTKLENLSEELKLQMNNIVESNNKYIREKINESEEKMQGLIQLYDDRLQDTRVENAHYSVGLEKKADELSKLITNVETTKTELYGKFDDEVKSMKDNYETTKVLFYKYKKQFRLLKDRFTQLAEFIKDVRFRANIGEEVKRREFILMGNKIDFTKKQPMEELLEEKRREIENNHNNKDEKHNYYSYVNDIASSSLVKRYISGELKTEDLFSFNHKNNATSGNETHSSQKANLMQNQFEKKDGDVNKNFQRKKTFSEEKNLKNNLVNKNFKRLATAEVQRTNHKLKINDNIILDDSSRDEESKNVQNSKSQKKILIENKKNKDYVIKEEDENLSDHSNKDNNIEEHNIQKKENEKLEKDKSITLDNINKEIEAERENEIEKNLITKKLKKKDNILKENNDNATYSSNINANLVVINGLNAVPNNQKISSQKPPLNNYIDQNVSRPYSNFVKACSQASNFKNNLLSVPNNKSNNLHNNTDNSKSNPSSSRKGPNSSSVKKRENDVIYAQNKPDYKVNYNKTEYNYNSNYPSITIESCKKPNYNQNSRSMNKNSMNKYNTYNNDPLQIISVKNNDFDYRNKRNQLKSASNSRDNYNRNKVKFNDYKNKDAKNAEKAFNKLVMNLPEETNNRNNFQNSIRPATGKSINSNYFGTMSKLKK